MAGAQAAAWTWIRQWQRQWQRVLAARLDECDKRRVIMTRQGWDELLHRANAAEIPPVRDE